MSHHEWKCVSRMWSSFSTYQEFAERIARHGYEVICPDLYRRYGHSSPDDVTKVRSEGGVPDDSVVAEAQAARDWLRSRPTSNGRVGAPRRPHTSGRACATRRVDGPTTSSVSASHSARGVQAHAWRDETPARGIRAGGD
jgi:hypothetical protein